MREQRLTRCGLAATGVIGFAYAMIAAGCGGGGSSSTPAVPNVASTVNPAAVCAAGSGGVVYLPDGGSAPHGITIQPFEQTNGTFIQNCAQTRISSSSAVGDLSISAYGDALAILNNGTQIVGLTGFAAGSVGTPSFTQFMASETSATSVITFPAGIFGLAVDQESPVPGPTAGLIGVNNILGLSPTPLPTATSLATSGPTASPVPNATATAYNPPIINPGQVAYTSIGVNPSATPANPGPSATPAIYQSTALAIPSKSVYGRPTIALGPDGSTILVRGDKDLLALQVVQTAGGEIYYVTYPAVGTSGSVPITPDNYSNAANGINNTLGYPTNLKPSGFAHGLVAFSPASSAHALIGGTPTSSTAVTLLNQVPNLLTVANQYNAANTVTSLAINPNGNIAAIGTTGGLEIVSGVNGSTLTKVTQTTFANGITYNNPKASGASALGKVISVGFSPDGRFLIVLADNTGGTASILAFAIDGNGILSSPLSGSTVPAILGAPITTPPDDYMVVH